MKKISKVIVDEKLKKTFVPLHLLNKVWNWKQIPCNKNLLGGKNIK